MDNIRGAIIDLDGRESGHPIPAIDVAITITCTLADIKKVLTVGIRVIP